MIHRGERFVLVFSLLTVLLSASLQGGTPAARPWGFTPPEPVAHALESINGRSLSGHISFLASDLLDGRPTPSVGQDVAAEYIAAQFRRSGLEPVGSQAYFQDVSMSQARPDRESFRCEIDVAGRRFVVPSGRFTMNAITTVGMDEVLVVMVPLEMRALEGLQALGGKVLMAVAPKDSPPPSREFYRRVAGLGPRLLVVVWRSGAEADGYFDRPQLRAQSVDIPGPSRRLLVAAINDLSVAEAFDSTAAGERRARISLHVAERPSGERVLRNVAGLLRGSDPILGDSYVLLTAHYDGTGPRTPDSADRIWNAANDNASGTAAVIEVASALSSLREKPRRSILFLCYFGEEKGLLGSRHYASHPLVPVEKTIAAINLEQLGRTDATEGDQTGRASVTGYDYSEVGEILRLAGEQAGIEVYRSERFSDLYFAASDNILLARMGVPSHTLCVSYRYPDYHGAADHCDRMDFANMEKVVRAVALAILFLVQSDQVPLWNESNPRAEPYARVRQQPFTR